MILNKKKKTLASITRYYFNSVILKLLPGKYRSIYLLYLRIKMDDELYKSLLVHDSLTQGQHQAIDKYWQKYYKIRHISHAFYTQKTGFFYKEYIPDSLWRRIIDPYFNDWKLAHYLDNKCYYHRMFTLLNVTLPKLIAYRLNDMWYNSNDEVITFDDVIRSVMSTNECFIKKAVESWGGAGVNYFSPSLQREDSLLNILNGIHGDLVIQEGVKQSKVLATINPDSVNTLRILSFLKKDGSVIILSSILRMGIKGSKVDNATNGGISVGVCDDGRLKGVAYTNRGEKFVEHPNSHIVFSDVNIPNYTEVINLVSRIHPKFPHFRLTNWDIALNQEDKPILIETNFNDGELDFHQLNNGPIFGEKTEEILSEVFSN